MGNYTGTSGDDTFPGSGGADTMTGLAGNDTYYVDDTADVVNEAAGEGNDRVAASVSYALAAGSEVETLEAITQSATTALNFTGNEFSNTIIGNNGINFLSGGGGSDTLIGLGGNDTMLGGAGNDAMYGGTGNDTYFVEDAGDQVIENGGEGNDRVAASVSYTLLAGSEVETLEAITQSATTALSFTGNEFSNTIIANEGANLISGGGGNDTLISLGGNDTLLGGAGNDAMYGGTGNDTYFVEDAGDQVIENGGEGNDRVAASVSYALLAGSEVETLEAITQSATNAMDLAGNAFSNTIIGNNGANVLNGGGGNDLMIGLGGNDVFIGSASAGTMYGGAGNDTYYVIDSADAVIENAGEGADRIAASTSYTLLAGSEVETLEAITSSATNALNFTGNEFANTIIGNNGANLLSGGGGGDTLVGLGGNDTMIGGGGNDAMYGGTGSDTYFVEDTGDAVVENAGEGNDRVAASVSYALLAGSEVETLEAITQSATTALDFTGNEFSNTIIGNNGVNVLNGGGGNDLLIGGGAADTFAFTTTLGAGNVDTIADFNTGGIDNIQLAGGAGQPFAALAAGFLQGGTVRIGTAALDDNDYLIYNSATGALFYDADGNGAAAAVQFATLSTGLNITSGSFEVSGPSNNAPTITSGATASVAENSSASTIVYQVVANDADGDRITYSLGGGDSALLTIDASGAVRLINPANFEAKSSYLFTVFAADSNTAGVQAVTLTITDVAESNPTPIINETGGSNDNRFNAQAIDPGTFLVADNPNLFNDDLPSATIVGSVSDHDDRDFFSITLQAGQLLVLDVDGTSGLDAHLRLYNEAGQEIGDNDDLIGPDPGSNPPFGHNTDSQIRFRAGASGIYYFSIEAFDDNSPQSDTFGPYQINVSIGPPATAAQLVQEDVEALISGAEWDHNNLTFGFPTMASQYPSSFREVSPAGDFQPFTAIQQAGTRQLLQLIANVSSLTFAELFGGTDPTSGAGSADLRYAMSTDPEVDVAYAFYPTNGGPTSPGGTAWFNTDDFDAPQRGGYAWMGILHETGHALGLKHGHEFPLAISADRNSVEYTVMTYRSYPGQNLGGGGGYSNEDWGYPQTLMMYDIAALQQMYGANFAFNNGNSVYSWDPSTGEMSINGVGQGAPGDGDANNTPSENRIFMTVWDGGGTDTYNLSAYSTGTLIDLRPGEWTTTSATQLAHLGPGHDARGNIANALMYQGNTASLIENAIGGGGFDTIYANQAANQLTGGGGNDTFRWASAAYAGTGALADTITDLVSGADRIDLSDIDAIPGTPANDAFAFIGTSAFHNVAGELRYQVEGGNVRVQADLDGNGIADMEIIVNNNTILAASDFFL